jgi:aerobic-type carbon monoxide dehydrogenase small subunit (CoxS/CutS family)
MGTIGGNVANAAACADSLPALICLDTRAQVLAIRNGSSPTPAQGEIVEQEWPVNELVTGPNRTRMPAGGLLVSLRYRVPESGSRSVFVKLGRRNAMAISRLTVAALGRLDVDGRIVEVRLVPGSATPQIRRFTAVEEMLLGRVADDSLIAEAGRAAVAEMRKLTGKRWSSEFKEPALAAMVQRALKSVLGADAGVIAAAQAFRPLGHRAAAETGKASAAPRSIRSSEPQASTTEITIRLTLNGQPVSVQAPANASLLTVLRDHLNLTGTKEGCGVGECGACSVLLDGRLVNSCLTLAAQASGRNVTTIEGIRGADGGPNDLQQAFIDQGAVQCGYCIPGMVLAGEALLATNPQPTRKEIRQAIAGNLCRCTGYQQIVDAIEVTAMQRMAQANA